MKPIPTSTVELTLLIGSSKLPTSSRISSPRLVGQGRSKSSGNMKKIVSIGFAGFVVIAIAGVIVLRTSAAKEAAARSTEVSPKAAKAAQQKIDTIKHAEND